MYKAVLFPSLDDTVSCVLCPLSGVQVLCARTLECAAVSHPNKKCALRGCSFPLILQSTTCYLQVKHFKNSCGLEKKTVLLASTYMYKTSFSNTVTLGQFYLLIE